MSHNAQRERDKPAQRVEANTLTLSRNGTSLLANFSGVGFIVWLDRRE
jgi:hypothetical protein